jgi:hypothetical protein
MSWLRKDKKYKKVCEVCGSQSITFEGSVIWNINKQEYYIADLYDHTYCGDCQDHVNVSDVEIIELNVNTKVL